MTYITQKGGDERKILYLMNQMKKMKGGVGPKENRKGKKIVMLDRCNLDNVVVQLTLPLLLHL